MGSPLSDHVTRSPTASLSGLRARARAVGETIAETVDRVEPVARLGVRRLTGRKSPFQMTFSLTNKCNFRCEYCHIPLQKRAELTTQQWCDAMTELQKGGMGRASLIGGEPLLRKDAGAIIRHLKSIGVHAAMNTNGWFVPERIDEVAELDLVCITLDGPPEVHDTQRHARSYEKAIEAIALLKRRGVKVVTMTVVTPAGADNVEHVLSVARDMDFQAFFQLEHDANCDVDAPIAPRLSDASVRAVAHRLMDLKRDGWPVGNSRPILESQARSSRYLGTCEDCHAGRYYGYVLSDGTVAPCLLTQWQMEAGSGARLGFLKAFQEMPAPMGPGCACVPTHEVNRILDFDLGVLWHAVDLALTR